MLLFYKFRQIIVYGRKSRITDIISSLQKGQCVQSSYFRGDSPQLVKICPQIQDTQCATLVYTSGTPRRAQPDPNDVSPRSSQRPRERHCSGPPLSPYTIKQNHQLINCPTTRRLVLKEGRKEFEGHNNCLVGSKILQSVDRIWYCSLNWRKC